MGRSNESIDGKKGWSQMTTVTSIKCLDNKREGKLKASHFREMWRVRFMTDIQASFCLSSLPPTKKLIKTIL